MRIDELREFDPSEVLTDRETVVAYLIEAARDNDPVFLQRAFHDVARSPFGSSALARVGDASRERINKALSENTDTKLSDVMDLLGALGLSMTFAQRQGLMCEEGDV